MCYGRNCAECNRCGKMDYLNRMLAKRPCRSCGREVSTSEAICPHCGARLKPDAPPPGAKGGAHG
ncbi:hypothetical protein DMP10_02985 [Adlercreutzia equolifaciens subsp. celatus DSM 18785]|uniref:Zinc-ribbon domain-containing protein n=1 Tax=Adlercreutzia equolifaciens subsp. celatus DSM 18785 TaxID=1121021 RepID=A0A3N0AWX5_9ACTN|nr:zinc-ribbon domain-containing protein [Adlercreutzia equolifaciens subsp. celatus]RNL39365.1 hypothetical protein DMP10_02985 [Adlercreutzia equolifaciens subsp. celatus DSM 18785]